MCIIKISPVGLNSVKSFFRFPRVNFSCHPEQSLTCRTLTCQWDGKSGGKVWLLLCACRRISAQGMCIAVVPLFAFNGTRNKNVIMPCLTRSPPCLYVFELWNKGKWQRSFFWQLSASPRQIRSDAARIIARCAVSIWWELPAEPSLMAGNMAITNSISST